MIQADVFAVLFMNEHTNLTNVVNSFTNKTVLTTFYFYFITALLYKLDIYFNRVDTIAYICISFCYFFSARFDFRGPTPSHVTPAEVLQRMRYGFTNDG